MVEVLFVGAAQRTNSTANVDYISCARVYLLKNWLDVSHSRRILRCSCILLLFLLQNNLHKYEYFAFVFVFVFKWFVVSLNRKYTLNKAYRVRSSVCNENGCIAVAQNKQIVNAIFFGRRSMVDLEHCMDSNYCTINFSTTRQMKRYAWRTSAEKMANFSNFFVCECTVILG